jgi:hypothetical protein
MSAAAIVAVVALAACPAARAACDSLCTTTPFSQPYPNSFWHLRLPADALVDNSTIAQKAAGRLAADAIASAGLSARDFNARIYVVPNDQPLVPIVINGSNNSSVLLTDALNHPGTRLEHGVPIPGGAEPSSSPLPSVGDADTDSEMVVYQPNWKDPGTNGGARGRVFEFFHLSSPAQNAPGCAPLPWQSPCFGDGMWHADWAGRDMYVATPNGTGGEVAKGHARDRWDRSSFDTVDALHKTSFEQQGWLATATSLPLLGGLITFKDWQRGAINHAIGMSVPHADVYRCSDPCKGYVWPAQRSDGAGAAGKLKEGMRFRLPPDFAIDQALPKFERMIEQAARDYGLVIWDGSDGSVGFRLEQQQDDLIWGECPGVQCANQWLQPPGSGAEGAGAMYTRQDGKGAYRQPYSTQSQVGILSEFPWRQLELLRPGCDAVPNPTPAKPGC